MVTNSQHHDRDLLYSQIENEYGSLVYSCAAQEEQRTRLARTAKRIKIAQIVLSALSTAGLVSTLLTVQACITIITTLITFLLLMLNSYSFRLEIDAKVIRHRRAGDQLWFLGRKYVSLLVDFSSLEIDEVRKRRDELNAEAAEIYSNVERTDDKSFATAQKRLKKDGLKEFSRDELNRLLPEALRK